LKISSRDNQRLRNARAVLAGKVRGSIFVEGVRLGEELVRSGLSVREAFYSSDASENQRLMSLVRSLADAGSAVLEVDGRAFRSVADTRSTQGVFIIADRPPSGPERIESKLRAGRPSLPLVLLLHRINNPLNLGAVLRTALASGAAGVVLTKGSADVFSAKGLRGSMGAAFRLPVWDSAGFDEALEWGRGGRLRPVAAAAGSGENYTDLDWRRPTLLVIGPEAGGLSPEELSAVGDSVSIPMDSAVESLNLAVSCGILLFEAKRQTDLSTG
jgi:TrmH family RNA methyltransferase